MKFTTRAAVAAVFCTASSGTAVVVSSWTPRLSSNVFLSSSATATSTTYQSFTPLIARRSGLRPRTAAAAGGGGRGATASGGVEKKYPVVLEAALDLQERLRKLCADKSTDKGDQRARIETLAEELNALNPTQEPARSPLLAGRWRMLYSTVPGPSSGRLGPFVGAVFQDIRPEEKKIVNILELGPSWALRGALEADVDILDGENWAINFDVVYNTFAGIQVQEKKFDPEVTERRIWCMTYLDDGFRILYGRQESMPVEQGFIFVMERERTP